MVVRGAAHMPPRWWWHAVNCAYLHVPKDCILRQVDRRAGPTGPSRPLPRAGRTTGRSWPVTKPRQSAQETSLVDSGDGRRKQENLYFLVKLMQIHGSSVAWHRGEVGGKHSGSMQRTS